MGSRISQTANSIVTQYLLDVQPSLVNVLAQTSGENTTRFVHGPRGILGYQNPSDEWGWVVQDGLGSVRGEVDNDLAVSGSRNLAPYGVEWGAQGEFGLPVGFTGEMADENDLVYLRARYYSPVMGVFPSLDPVENLNRYQYVSGNPVNLVDPSGMAMENPARWDSCQLMNAGCDDGVIALLWWPSSYPFGESSIRSQTEAWERIGTGSLAQDPRQIREGDQIITSNDVFSSSGYGLEFCCNKSFLNFAPNMAIVVGEKYNDAYDGLYGVQIVNMTMDTAEGTILRNELMSKSREDLQDYLYPGVSVGRHIQSFWEGGAVTYSTAPQAWVEHPLNLLPFTYQNDCFEPACQRTVTTYVPSTEWDEWERDLVPEWLSQMIRTTHANVPGINIKKYSSCNLTPKQASDITLSALGLVPGAGIATGITLCAGAIGLEAADAYMENLSEQAASQRIMNVTGTCLPTLLKGIEAEVPVLGEALAISTIVSNIYDACR
jgi:RHS repeat-associated protein